MRLAARFSDFFQISCVDIVANYFIYCSVIASASSAGHSKFICFTYLQSVFFIIYLLILCITWSCRVLFWKLKLKSLILNLWVLVTWCMFWSGVWFWPFPLKSKHISFIKVGCWNCKFHYLSASCLSVWLLLYIIIVYVETSLNCNFFHSQSGWHLKFSAMNHLMKNQICIVLE